MEWERQGRSWVRLLWLWEEGAVGTRSSGKGVPWRIRTWCTEQSRRLVWQMPRHHRFSKYLQCCCSASSEWHHSCVTGTSPFCVLTGAQLYTRQEPAWVPQHFSVLPTTSGHFLGKQTCQHASQSSCKHLLAQIRSFSGINQGTGWSGDYAALPGSQSHNQQCRTVRMLQKGGQSMGKSHLQSFAGLLSDRGWDTAVFHAECN